VSRSGSLPGDEGAGAGPGTGSPSGHARDWRARKRDETRERIYTAAMRLFTQHGFDQVSVAQVAEAADVSVPTFYAHFPSKEQVLIQLPTGEEIAAVLATQPAGLTAAARMQRGIRDWFAQVGPAELDEVRTRWRVVADSPSLRVRAAGYERATAALVLDALRSARGCAAVPAEEVVVTAYMAVLTAVLLAWATDDSGHSLVDLADEAFEILRRP
jgi:AcrR family transcriptional regulator